MTDQREPLSCFGELLNAAWTTKRALSPRISSDQIDRWYERARTEGAIGGKLLGAGGGGFLLLLVPPGKQDRVVSALPELRRVPFEFDRTGRYLDLLQSFLRPGGQKTTGEREKGSSGWLSVVAVPRFAR